MADDKTIVEIGADISGLKTGSAEAAAVNKATTQSIKTDWAATTGTVAASVATMGTEIRGTLAGISSGFLGIQSSFLALTAVLGGGALFSNMISKTLDWTAQVKTLSRTLGMTSEDASVLAVALTHAGIGIDDYAQGSKKIAATLLRNEKAFGDLDVKVRNSDGTYKDAQTIMMSVVQALGNMKEGTDRNVASAEIFKRANIDVAKLMSLNAEAFEAARVKAERLHLIVGPEGAAMAKQYKESLNDLKLESDSFSIVIGSKLLPVLTTFGGLILGIPSAIEKFTTEHKNLVQGVTTGIVVWGTYTLAVNLWTAAVAAGVTMQGIATSATYLWGEAVTFLELGFGALTGAEMLALGGWVIAAIAGIATYMNGFAQTVNDTVDIVIELGRALEKAFYLGKSVIDMLRMDLKAAQGDFAKGLTIDIKEGTGQDWYSKIKDKISGLTTPDKLDLGPKLGTSDQDFEGGGIKQPKGPKPQTEYELAKAAYQEDIADQQLTADKKLVIYKEYLENVNKSAKEQQNYSRGLGALELQARKDDIEKQKAFLDLAAAENVNSSTVGMQKRMDILEQETALVADVYGTDSKEWAEAKTKEVELAQKLADLQYQIAKDLTDKKEQLANDQIDLLIEEVKYKYELGQISEINEIAQLNDLEAKKRQIKLKSLQDDLALIGIDKGTDSSQYKKQLTAIQLYQSQMNLAATKGSNQLSKTLQKPWIDLKKSVQSSLQSSIASFLKGSVSIMGAVRSLAVGIGSAMADMWAKDLAATIMGTSAKTAAIGAGAAAQTGITAAAAGASVAATVTTTAANMTMLESIGTALASIPWYGWVGLAILAGVSSARGSSGNDTGGGNLGRSPDSYYSTPSGIGLPSYDVGSWGLPSDGPIMAHKNEIIVPEKGGFADAFRNGTLGQSKGNTNSQSSSVVMNIHASAIDGMGVGRIIGNAGRHAAAGLQKVSRSLSMPNQTKWGRV